MIETMFKPISFSMSWCSFYGNKCDLNLKNPDKSWYAQLGSGMLSCKKRKEKLIKMS